MPFPLPRCAAVPVLATVLAGAVLVADPTVAPASAATHAAASAAAPGSTAVTAALEVSSATEWYTSGQFVVRNTGSTPTGWQLRFRVAGGTFDNWASWMSDTTRDGDVVTITAKPGQELAPGASANLSFGVSGDGSAVPTITACSIDGADVQGCEPEDGGDPEPPSEDTEAPSAVQDLVGEAVDAHTVQLRWGAATDDRGVDAHVVERDGAEPLRLDGDVREARIGDLPDGATHRFTVRAVDAAGNVGPAATVEVATPAEPQPEQQLVVEADHSIVPVRALGDPEQARVAEGRQFRHSSHEPTGRFLTTGDEVVVTVPDGVSGLVARFGMIGRYAGINGGQVVGTTEVALQPGENRVTAPKSGSLQLRDTAPEGARSTTVRVEGGQAMAVAVEGETTEAEWLERMATLDAPIVELVGSNVMVQIQRATAQRWLVDEHTEVNPRIRMIERVVAKTDQVFGLDRDGSGVAHRADQRILIVNPDSGNGHANANHDRLEFHNGSGAMKGLLTGRPRDKWALWHEIGHTYQPDWMKWGDLMEVSVNVPSLANQEREGAPNRLDDASTRKKAATYFAMPEAERRFDDQDPWLQTLMFDQLRRAFGEDVYAQMAQRMRADAALGVPAASRTDLAASHQQFARVAAASTGRDLSAFFTAWGMPLTAETRASMADLPAPSFDLTANHDRPTDRVEHEVSYTVPTGAVSTTGSATYGQRLPGDSVTVTAEHADDVAVGRNAVIAMSLGAGAGRAALELRSPDGTPNVFSSAIDVTRGTMVQYQGVDDRVIAELVLDPGTGRLWLHRAGGSRQAHYGFSSRYAGVKVVSTDGEVLRDAWMKGTETAGAFGHRFGEVPVVDGQYLVLDHREPKNRMLRWSAGTELARSTDREQAFRIQGSTLVPVPLSEVPGR